MKHAHIAQQGHRYSLDGRDVLALDSGHVARVAEIHMEKPWPLGQEHTVKASWLVPLPMVYFAGEVPA